MSDIDTAELKEALGMTERPPPPVFVIGQVLDGSYRIDAELGAGGMGRVYRAHDIRLGRDIAIKLHALAFGDGRHWSLREAAALARLSHPNVVTVFEVGESDGHPWVAMEYVPGGTARTWLAAKPRTRRDILALYVAAGRGLAAAHAAGIVHRDFKPDNVLVTGDDQPRVADFGLALVGDTPAAAHLAVGTPGYMAPEQWEDRAIGPAADQFAFAVAVWEALTGVRPFPGITTDDLRAALSAPPKGPARPLPRHVETALRRALSYDPADRWSSLEPLLRELARDPQRTRRLGASLALASLVFVGAGVAIARATNDDAQTEPPCARASDAIAPTLAARGALVRPEDRALPKLDAWIARWKTARMTACTDTHVARTQPLAMLELRAHCLSGLLANLSATVRELANPKADSVALVESLPAVAECEDLVQLGNRPPLPTDLAHRAQVQDIEEKLWALEVTRAAGRPKEALEGAIALKPRAAATNRKSLMAFAEIAHASLLVANGTYDVAPMFERAALFAAEGRDDYFAALAWAHLLDVYVARLEQTDKAVLVLPVAEAAVVRAGNPPRLQSRLLALTAEVAKKQGNLALARTRYQQAIALHEQTRGADSELARQLNRLATIELNMDDLASARSHLERASNVLESNYGPTYRHLAVLWTTLGGVEERALNWAAARAIYERALALKESTGGPTSITLVPTLMGLASALSQLGEHDRAIAAIDRAIEIGQKQLGEQHPKVVDAKQLRVKILTPQPR